MPLDAKGGRMPGPHLIVELSAPLLTKFMHNAVATLFSCPSPPQLVTDLDVVEVLPLRRDDPAFNDAAQFTNFDNIEGLLQITLPAVDKLVVQTTAGSKSVQVPSIFLMVSLRFRQ